MKHLPTLHGEAMLMFENLPAVLLQAAPDAIPVPGFGDFSAANIIQWGIALSGMIAALWLWKEKATASKKASHDIEAELRISLRDEITHAIHRANRAQKEADKFWALRRLVLDIVPDGSRLVEEAEKIADSISSDEE